MGQLNNEIMGRHERNRAIRNNDAFLSLFSKKLKANSLAKMKKDGYNTGDPKLVEKHEALYISACIYELSNNSKKYYR